MILRHERDKSSGRWNENVFLAIDERTGDELGRAEIIPEELSVMFPLRPLQVLLDLGNPPVPDRLLGAAVARAKKLCAESEQFCRLYAQLDPDDDELLDALTALGFIDNDGLVRMQMRLPTERDFPLPEGADVVYDDLSNPQERKYCLQRMNLLYGTRYGMGWLDSYTNHRNFQRILMLADDGIMAEALIWREGYAGEIGYFQVAKRWRNMGVGKYLLSLACDCFERQNLYCAEASVRARYPHVLKLMRSVGFKQAELLMRYPGIDINPR